MPAIYQPLKECYRTCGGGLGIAKHLSGVQFDAAYEYTNWYLSGWVGASLNRQSYYSAALDTAKNLLTADERGYWVEGKIMEKPVPCVTAARLKSGSAWFPAGTW